MSSDKKKLPKYLMNKFVTVIKLTQIKSHFVKTEWCRREMQEK